MSTVLQQLLSLVNLFENSQPMLMVLLGAALVALFFTVALAVKGDEPSRGLAWTIYLRLGRFLWAAVLVGLIVGAASGLGSYLDRSVASFRHDHGRVTEENLNAVRTIWGEEQVQGELSVALGYDEEEVERLEPEDPSKPAVLRKKTIHHAVTANPFVSARHEVTLRKNPRKKGPAIYPGYETDCRFTYHLKNPSDRDVKATLKFPLPAASAMFNDLAISLNGASVRDRLRVNDGALVLDQDLKAGGTVDFEVAFKSRGLSHWYFQVRDAREIRDFQLTLRLPDLPRKELNYPEGCMTPTEITATTDHRGSVLAFRLDRALSNKGMGVELPKLTQPGEMTGAVLAEVRKGWVLLLAAVLLGATLSAQKYAVLLSVLVGAAAALGYGFLGDFSDTVLGFWGTAAVIVLPLFAVLSWLLKRTMPGMTGTFVCGELVLFGLIYPCLAGLDAERQTMYLNLSALVFLAIAAWQLTGKVSRE